tara:strand:- start:326 stop:1399 length:1074 start_codon:yes stop_codon:yes gene_type:complete
MNMPAYIFFTLLLLQTGCGILGPDKENPLEPGRRDYTWAVDTVGNDPDMWVGWGNTIWGSAPNDVWLGLSGGHYNLWHYDGESWTPWPYREGPNGFTGDFNTIYGFAQNDVWMGGKGPGGRGIWHFDGTEWKLAHTYQPEGMGEPNVIDMWGSSSSDIYTVGTVPTGQGNPSYKGFILHYNGSTWEEVLMTDFGMQFQQIRENKKGTYIHGGGPYSTQLLPDSASIYKLNNNHLEELYSKSSRDAGTPRLNKISNKIYFVLENEVTDTDFNGILPFKISEDVYDVNGRHAKDLFITTEYGVLHYNGEDTEYLLTLESSSSVVFRTFIMGNDVFFLVNDNSTGTNLIYHGILPKEQEE